MSKIEATGKTKYLPRVRWAVLTACVLGLVGCYNPSVKDGGFLCSPSDNPPCPSGFSCVDGVCVNHPGVTVTHDMAMTSGTQQDFATAAGPDLAQSVSVDFAVVPAADMAQSGGSCGKQGDICLKNSDCCNNVCLLVVCAL